MAAATNVQFSSQRLDNLLNFNKSRPILRTFQFPDRQAISLQSLDGLHLNISLDSKEILAYVRSVVQILDASLLETDNAFHILCSTADGLYLIPLNRIGGRSGETVGSSSDDNDIFGELLAKNDRTDGLAIKNNQNNINIDLSDHHVYSIKDIIQILIVDNSIVLLTIAAYGYLISVFEDQEILKLKHTETNLIPVFTKFLPFRDREQDLRTMPSCYSYYGAPNQKPTNDDNRFLERSKIFCIIPYSDNLKKTSCRRNTLELNSQLYNQLFSLDLNLLDCPVLLCCLPNGVVYSVPLKNKVVCHKDIHVFYDLGEPVVGIHGLAHTSGKECADMMILIGANGKLVQIVSGAQQAIYKEHTITGSVIASAVIFNCLYHSTYKDVFQTDFSSGNESTCTQHQKSEVLKSESLGYGRIIGFTEARTQDASSMMQVFGLVSNGRLLKINTSSTKHQDREHTKHKMKQTNQGQRLKDLLVSINTVSERQKNVNSELSSQNVILSQLNIASTLICDYFSLSKSLESILKCDTAVQCHNTGSLLQYEIITRLENRSCIPFANGWSFAATVKFNQNDEDSRHVKSITQSVGLKHFEQGKFHEISFKLDKSHITQLPFVVDSVLVYRLFSGDNDRVIGESESITVPLIQQSIDILHFLLRPPSRLLANCKVENTLPDNTDVGDILFGIARTKPGCSLLKESETVQKISKICTVMLPVCVNSFKDEPIKLLQFLLTDSQINLSDINSRHVKLITPEGNQVTLTAQKAEDTARAKADNTSQPLEISMSGPCLSDVCDIRRACSKRILTTSSDSLQKYTTSTKHLRKVLSEVEEIRSELMTLQDVVSDGTVNGNKTAEQIVGLYERLRSIKVL